MSGTVVCCVCLIVTVVVGVVIIVIIASDTTTILLYYIYYIILGPILCILYTQPLSDIISHHSVSHHMFADDTELYKSDSPSETFSHTIEACRRSG